MIIVYLKKTFLHVIKFFLGNVSPACLAKFIYFSIFKRRLNLKNPKDLNEKINWLKFNSDTSMWSKLADKYRVREYILEKGMPELLTKLYGVWENADDIDFNLLPEKFVLKTNHGCGDVIIVRDKTKINTSEIKATLNRSLKNRYGKIQAEPHYLKIKPCIIAEELLQNDLPNISSSIIDYKVFCFNGKANHILCFYNRTKQTVMVENHDLEWRFHPEWHRENHHYLGGNNQIPKPKSLNQLIETAEKLAEGFPQVRVDLYIANNKIYFGEMTFTSMGGYMTYYTPDFLLRTGMLIKIPPFKNTAIGSCN